MGDISFGGLATGLPTEDLITAFIEADSAPLYRLQDKEEEEALKLEAYKEYDGLLETLRETVSGMNSTGEVRSTSVDLSDDDYVSVTSDGAATGSHTISVIQLAQVQKTVTDGVSSQDDAIFSNGTISIGDTGITIDDTNNSLTGIMAAINATSDETGVTASIINDGGDSNNYHLVLTGEDASTSFSFGNDLTYYKDGEDVLLNADHTAVAQQAVAIIDGIEVVSNSNKINSSVAGLNITLNDVSEVITPADEETGTGAVYATTTINVEPDTDSLKEKITEFVSAYNDIMNWIAEGYEYDSDDETTTTDDDDDDSSSYSTGYLSNVLKGDSSVNSAKRELQTILTSAGDTNSTYQILAEIGITTQTDGTLQVSSTKLDAALDENYNDVVTLLAGDETNDGLMDNFNDSLLDLTSSTTGMYAMKEDTYDMLITSLDKQIEQQESRLESIEERYTSQFTALELLVSGMNSEGDYIASYFSSSS